MESASFTVKKVHVVRVDPGEDVLASVEKFLKEKKVQQAVVLNGYGTLAAWSLHWVTHNRIPTENLFRKGEGGIEILSMSGLVVQGRPHIHVALSKPEGAFGGHLEPGCVAYVLCEITIAEIEGARLERRGVQLDVPGMGKGEIQRLFFT